MTPIIKLPAMPKPFPFIILPDSQPASIPIKRKIIICILYTFVCHDVYKYCQCANFIYRS
jgi:hypothetical protein